MLPSEKFIEALTKFADSAHELRQIWTQEEKEKGETMFFDEYPFDKGFHEIVADIERWVNSCQ